MIYFDDIQVGQQAVFGPLIVSADEIVDFARKYDPQPFHLSDAGARDTFFGSLAASGWHTAAMTMKLIVTGRSEPWADLGSPGFDDLRWQQPVYPGDRLRVHTTVQDKQASASSAQQGTVRLYVETANQHAEVVMSMTLSALLERRLASV